MESRAIKLTRYILQRLLLALGVLTVVASAQASKERPVIGLSLDTLSIDRWQHDRDNFVANAHRLGAVVIVEGANSDDDKQNEQIESMVSRAVDVLVIIPHDSTKLGRAIAAANKANIPVICYDRLCLNADVSCYLSFDNLAVGAAQASYLASRLPTDRPAKIVRIYGAPSDNNAKMFKQGQDQIIDPLVKAGRVEVVYEGWAEEWKPEEGKRIMTEALAKFGPEIDAVLASNDSTAGGAVEALTEHDLAGKVLVTGQDADLAACARINEGTQSMTVYKPISKLAQLAAEVAVGWAKGQVPTATMTTNNGLKEVPSIFQKVISVDKGNLRSTVVADGFHRG